MFDFARTERHTTLCLSLTDGEDVVVLTIVNNATVPLYAYAGEAMFTRLEINGEVVVEGHSFQPLWPQD